MLLSILHVLWLLSPAVAGALRDFWEDLRSLGGHNPPAELCRTASRRLFPMSRQKWIKLGLLGSDSEPSAEPSASQWHTCFPEPSRTHPQALVGQALIFVVETLLSCVVPVFGR